MRPRRLPRSLVVATVLAVVGLSPVPALAAPSEPAPTATDPGSPANDNTPLILGSADPGSVITIFTDSSCTAVAATGSAEEFAAPGIEVTVPDDSTTTFWAMSHDGTDPSLCSSTSVVYEEDSTAPAEPTFAGTDPSSPANENAPLIVGLAEVGSIVRLYADVNCAGVPAATGPAFEFGAPGLSVAVSDDDATTFFARATDAAGNASTCSSDSERYVEDSTAPNPPVFTSSNPPSPADDMLPFIRGSAETAADVRLFTDASCAGPLAAGGDAEDFFSPGFQVSVLEGSTTAFFADAEDRAGNVSACSPTSFAYVEAPIGGGRDPFTRPDLVPSSDTGSSPSDDLTNDVSPTFAGSAAPASAIVLYIHGIQHGIATAAVDGTWTITTFPALDGGTHDVYVRVADGVNPAFFSESLFVVVDTTAPTVSIDQVPLELSNDATPTFAFSSSEVSSTFECSLTTGGTTYEACSTPATFGPLASGDYTFRVRATDAAGNVGNAETDGFTVDVTPPPPPSRPDLVSASDSGSSATDNLTNDATPRFTGFAEVGAIVTLLVDGVPRGIDVDGDGTWGITTSLLAEGSHLIVARTTDPAGNTGAVSLSLTVRIDTTAPFVTSPRHAIIAGSAISSGRVSVRISWAGSDAFGIKGYTLQISSNGGANWWNVGLATPTATTVIQPLTPGPSMRNYRVRATDGAGNVSGWATGQQFQVSAAQETNPAIVYAGLWTPVIQPLAWGGSLRHASAERDSATFTFTGDAIAWVGTLGPLSGTANVWIDGSFAESVNLFSVSTKFARVVFADTLTPGSHRITVVVMGTPSQAAHFDVDAFAYLT